MEKLILSITENEDNIIKNNKNIKLNNDRVDYNNCVCIKPWGYEFLTYESDKLGIWYLKINKGHSTSLHTHFKKDTIVFVISGTAKLSLIDNEVRCMGPMSYVYIPKNKFHALSSFSEEVYLLEIEIFDKDVTFSDKNDLLRIYDEYHRKKTGYESSVQRITEYLEQYDYFKINDSLHKFINNTELSLYTLDQNTQWKDGYHIILEGELFINNKYIKEGSLLNKEDFENNETYSNNKILYLSNPYAYEDNKIIYSMEQLKVVIQKLKNSKKKIVLTSGCYDIIHVGHLSTLKSSKLLGDCLMVCLSNDIQIEKLKGKGRPVNHYKDRIDLFKIIPYVDYIILYNEDDIEKEETLNTIMKIVNPYCWTKGSDYTVEKILDKHPHLNKIVLLDNIENKSTTNIIHKIINN
jgi:rfaE bifunctional protein nucleotidyltransferase chain/domain